MSPEQIKLLIYAGISAVLFAAGWTVNGWRLGEKLEHVEAERDTAIAQGDVLASAVDACNDGVKAAKAASDSAAKLSAQLLEDARRRAAAAAGKAAQLEDALRRGGTGCDAAWDEIEKAYNK